MTRKFSTYGSLNSTRRIAFCNFELTSRTLRHRSASPRSVEQPWRTTLPGPHPSGLCKDSRKIKTALKWPYEVPSTQTSAFCKPRSKMHESMVAAALKVVQAHN
eukprot:6207963-Pleurochrysis_carterae.AAC.2